MLATPQRCRCSPAGLSELISTVPNGPPPLIQGNDRSPPPPRALGSRGTWIRLDNGAVVDGEDAEGLMVLPPCKHEEQHSQADLDLLDAGLADAVTKLVAIEVKDLVDPAQANPAGEGKADAARRTAEGRRQVAEG